MTWLGLDIGGANIKIADGSGYAESVSFPLWKRPHELSAALQDLLAKAPTSDSLAITMTGELADCFATKADGVHHILDAAEEASGSRHIRVYLTNGNFTTPDEARSQPLLAAASNWHVLATFAMRYLHAKSGLLIDIGSTTTDLIPIGPMLVGGGGRTDSERLANGSLVYTGVRRSPVCALVANLPWQNNMCRVAQELFATTLDAYIVLGDLPEEPDNCDTADGRPCTQQYAHARLARMVCADATMFSWADATEAAQVVCGAQVEMIATAASQSVRHQPSTVVVSGEGEFLAHKVMRRLGWECNIVSLNDELGPQVSRAACAHALAVLARERTET